MGNYKDIIKKKYKDYIMDLEDWVFDCSPYINYSEQLQYKVRKQFLDEWDLNESLVVTDKKKWANRQTAIKDDGTLTKNPPMNGWGRVHVLFRKHINSPQGPIDQIFEQLPKLPEQHRIGWRWQFMIDNTIPFHKDPSSKCWLGIMVSGNQDIRFAIENGEKQRDGIDIGGINYKVALINSQKLHAPVSDGRPRCILRYVFTETSYNDMKLLLKEHFWK